MDKFRINLRNKVDKYVKLSGFSYRYFRGNNGLGGLGNIRKNGSTTLKILFELSKFLNIDIRNLLMFDDSTYIFENSFADFEGFSIFLGKKFKNFRNEKKISAKRFVEKLNKPIIPQIIYDFEGARYKISLNKLYEYLNILEVTPDEFFLKDENYKIIGNQIKNQISINDFNNRIYEIEEIKGRIVGGNLFSNPNDFPTLHGFLKICKSLKVNPKDFFDFDKKDFDEDFKIIDISSSVNFIKNKLEDSGISLQRYIKLDVIFLFCKEKNISIKDFFDVSSVIGKISKTNSNVL